MNPYHHPDYAAFMAALRTSPDDRVTPLVCADWLEERNKIDHARFIRGCVRIGELVRKERGNPLDTFDRWTEESTLYGELRPLIEKYAHEWTAGAVRKFSNPTAGDWKNGFLWHWHFVPYKPGSDRETDHGARKKLAAILARQPITSVGVQFPNGTFASPPYILSRFADEFRGVTFRCGAVSVSRPAEEGATNG